jgi:zinc transporter ZupT
MDPCLPDLFTDKYPAMPGVIMMGSMFCLFIIEMYLNGKMGGHSHSHGGPMGFETHSHPPAAPVPAPANRGPPSRPPRYTSASDFEIEDIDYEKKLAQKMYDEKMRDGQLKNPYADDDTAYPTAPSEMPPWFVVFYEQYVRQRLEMINMIKSANQHHQSDTDNSSKRQTITSSTTAVDPTDSPYIDEETGQAVDPAVFRKMSMNITLLEGGILFHSVFVGMTVSITVDGFLVLLVAIMFHQMFEGLGLGARIAAVPYPRGSVRPWLLVVAFGMTAPIGQAIGLAVKDSYDPNSAFGLIIVGVFNAM